MTEAIKKYWIAAIGISFVFLSFVYFLKLAFDRNWIPAIVVVVLGFVAGAGFLIGGYSTYTNLQKKLLAQALAGFGAAIIYATLVYSGFSDELMWPKNVVLICFVALTALVTWFAYMLDMRLLMNMSMAGGLLVPIVIKASPHQIDLLFIYVLLLNIAVLFVSVIKRWKELPIGAFFLTLIIFITYYIIIKPDNYFDPFAYVTSFFIVYAFGLILASWKDQKNFEGFNLFLGIINALNFVFWTYLIFKHFHLSASIPITFVGMIFLLSSLLIYKLSDQASLPVLSYFFLGILVIATAGPNMDFGFTTPGLHFVIKASVWLFLIVLLYITSHYLGSAIFNYISIIAWFMLFLYWFGVAWKVEWVRWFGVQYIPFINPGALVWIAMSITGFTMSVLQEKKSIIDSYRYPVFPARLLGLVAHLLVGGLFTIQIQNAWDAYSLHFIEMNLMLSIMWGLYAAGLFMWGAWTRGRVYRWAGSIVLVLISIKAITYDLSGSDTIYKAGFLFIMGIIMLVIFYINSRWDDDEQKNADLEDKNSTPE